MIAVRRLAAISVIALGGLFLLNLFVWFLARHSSKHQLVASLARPGPVVGIFSGSSLIEIGVNVTDFAAAWPPQQPPARFLDCGLGNTTPVEHCLILREALRHHPEPKFVVYGFAGADLTDSPDGSWPVVRANRTVSYDLEPGLAGRLYGGSTLDRLRFEYIRFLPLAGERYLLWNRVELLRRTLQEVGLPAAATSRYGRVDDFASMEGLYSQAVLTGGRAAIADHRPLIAAVRELLASGEDTGRRAVYVVEMPLPPAYAELVFKTDVWRQYRAYVRQLVEQQGAHYIDAHEWVTEKSEFLDAIHLNPAGASRFSRQLAQTLAPLVEAPKP